MFKYFTTLQGKSIAINPLHVMHIMEYTLSRPGSVILNMTNGEKINITDPYLEVVNSLSVV